MADNDVAETKGTENQDLPKEEPGLAEAKDDKETMGGEEPASPVGTEEE